MNLMSLVSIFTGVLMLASALLFYLYGRNFFFRGPPAYVYMVVLGFVLAAASEITVFLTGEYGMIYGVQISAAALIVLAGFITGFYGSRGGGI